jgi:AcrR family transcriptional regulator
LNERRLIPPPVAEAVVELMAAEGYESVSPEAVAERAGISRPEFDHLFESVEDCVLRVYWLYTDAFTDLLQAAYDEGDGWRDGLRRAAYQGARYIRDNPDMVRFGTIELFGAGLMAQAQRASHLQSMVDLIDAGRQELEEPDSVGRGVAEGVFGSIYELVLREVQQGAGTAEAESYIPDLMYLAVRPYLGHEVASEELSIPPPPESHPRIDWRQTVRPKAVDG